MIKSARIENDNALCAVCGKVKDILVAYLNGLAVKLGFEVFVNLFGLSRMIMKNTSRHGVSSFGGVRLITVL